MYGRYWMRRSSFKAVKRVVALFVACAFVLGAVFGFDIDALAAGDGNISITVHQQYYGNITGVKSGETAGRVRTGKRIEGFAVKKAAGMPAGSIVYRSYVQTKGWTPWVRDGQYSGTKGQSLRMEAFQVKLTGALAQSYDVYYRAYVTGLGWLAWTKNSGTVGTKQCSLSIEGFQLRLVRKAAKKPVENGRSFVQASDVNAVAYNAISISGSELADARNGAVLGDLGHERGFDRIRMRLSHNEGKFDGGINYQVYRRGKGWTWIIGENTYSDLGASNGDNHIEAVRIWLTGESDKYCDVYYRVHIKNGSWLAWAKNAEMTGWTNGWKYIDGLQVQLKLKSKPAPDNDGAVDTFIEDGLKRSNSLASGMTHMYQKPELRSGCESVALTMQLNYFGFGLAKTTIADNYLVYSSSYVTGFQGSPYGYPGGGIYTPGLQRTANNFLIERGSNLRAYDYTGTDLGDLYQFVSAGYPVLVWHTCEWEWPKYDGYTTYYNGRAYQWVTNEHCLVLTGYDLDRNTVTVYDSIDGILTHDRDYFEAVYNNVFKQAMVIM